MPKLNVDKQLIRDLAELLAETGLNEIEWSEAGVQLRIARGGGIVSMVPPTVAPAPGSNIEAPAAVDLNNHPGAVKSPMVGTVYVAPEPGAPNFVRIGDTIEAGQTVLIVEAMKTMNPIPAPRGGKVTQILIDNQSPVEYGQVMMLIE